MPDLVSIYALADPRTGEIRYVGWTSKSLEERLRNHLRDNHRCHRTWWIKSLKRQSLQPVVRLVQSVQKSDWKVAERYWIAYFWSLGCPLTNGTAGGEGILGHKHSPATRAKLRAAAKRQFADPAARAAVSQVHKGKHISKVHRAIVGAATKKRWADWRANGAVTSPATRVKISAARKGKSLSPEHKAQISRTLKGRPKSLEHRAKLAAANRARAAARKGS